MKGYLQVYTGPGKGKTTAAIGLAVRAAGAGLKVYFTQFIKGGEYSEIVALARFQDLIVVEQFGLGRFLKGKPAAEDVRAAKQGLEKIKKIIASGRYDVVILDEANVAVGCGLFSIDELLEIVEKRAAATELVITGRNAAPELLARADLVTEMRELKHYFAQGVQARTGIEK